MAVSGDLCVDSRPAVRKSAGQTLFSTISAHGGLLHQPTWQAVLWQACVSSVINTFSSCMMDAEMQGVHACMRSYLTVQMISFIVQHMNFTETACCHLF
jgi:hypothetical protein